MKKLLASKFLKKVVSISFVLSLASSQTFAAGTGTTGTPAFFTSIENAFKAGAGWIGGIVAGSTAFYVGWHAWQKSMTDDEAVIAQKNKLIKNALTGAAIVLGGGGVVTAILAFF